MWASRRRSASTIVRPSPLSAGLPPRRLAHSTDAAPGTAPRVSHRCRRSVGAGRIVNWCAAKEREAYRLVAPGGRGQVDVRVETRAVVPGSRRRTPSYRVGTEQVRGRLGLRVRRPRRGEFGAVRGSRVDVSPWNNRGGTSFPFAPWICTMRREDGETAAAAATATVQAAFVDNVAGR